MPNVKIEQDSSRTDTENKRVVYEARRLADEEWYSPHIDANDEPCVSDFSDLAHAIGRTVSDAECNIFTDAWRTRMTEHRSKAA